MRSQTGPSTVWRRLFDFGPQLGIAVQIVLISIYVPIAIEVRGGAAQFRSPTCHCKELAAVVLHSVKDAPGGGSKIHKEHIVCHLVRVGLLDSEAQPHVLALLRLCGVLAGR